MNMKKALAYMRKYLRTYSNQLFWEKYSEDTWLRDILYGLGVSIDKERYAWRDGLDLFLIEKIKPMIEEIEQNEIRSGNVQRRMAEKESQEASSEDCPSARTSSG